MPVIGNLQSCHLRVLLPLWLAALGLVLPGVSKADDTNGTWPVVSVQVAGNAAESGSPSGAFMIQRTGDTGQTLVVNYRISGTATNGVDYQRLSGTVTIPAGQSAAQIEVTPIDHQQEGDSKNVTLMLVTRNQPFTIIFNPPTLTGGVNPPPSSTNSYYVLRHIRIVNKTGSAATFTLYLGG